MNMLTRDEAIRLVWKAVNLYSEGHNNELGRGADRAAFQCGRHCVKVSCQFIDKFPLLKGVTMEFVRSVFTHIENYIDVRIAWYAAQNWNYYSILCEQMKCEYEIMQEAEGREWSSIIVPIESAYVYNGEPIVVVQPIVPSISYIRSHAKADGTFKFKWWNEPVIMTEEILNWLSARSARSDCENCTYRIDSSEEDNACVGCPLRDSFHFFDLLRDYWPHEEEVAQFFRLMALARQDETFCVMFRDLHADNLGTCDGKTLQVIDYGLCESSS